VRGVCLRRNGADDVAGFYRLEELGLLEATFVLKV
jgi:hypothetical protein